MRTEDDISTDHFPALSQLLDDHDGLRQVAHHTSGHLGHQGLLEAPALLYHQISDTSPATSGRSVQVEIVVIYTSLESYILVFRVSGSIHRYISCFYTIFSLAQVIEMGATVPPFWQDDSNEDYHTTRCFSLSLEFSTLLVIHTAG